jgi:anti-sigma B factor antagonist
MYKDTPDDMEDIKCWIIKGAYQKENVEQRQKCGQCAYYLKMQENSGVTSRLTSDIAIITIDGSVNNNKTRALDQVWQNLFQNRQFKILLDLSKVNFIYSCGLGQLVKIHKEAVENGGIVVLLGMSEEILKILQSAKLTKLFHIAANQKQAIAFFDEFKKKIDAQLKASQPQPQEIVSAPAKEPPKWIPCWEYWKDHNPKNATKCDECYKKASQSQAPCWLVEGFVEGVSFQFVNEECHTCPYFEKYYV